MRGAQCFIAHITSGYLDAQNIVSTAGFDQVVHQRNV